MTKKPRSRIDDGVRKGDLAALLSHELRTPLNAIIGFAEMLNGEMLGNLGNQRYREYARHILESGTHLHDVISDMLIVMSDHGSGLPPDVEPIDPAAAVAASLNLVRHEAKAAGVRLEARNADMPVRLLADHNAIAKILTVLVQDAISSAHRGDRISVSVDLAARRRGLVYSIERSALLRAQKTGRQLSDGAGFADSAPFQQPEMPDLGPAIWNWLVRLNGGRLDLDRDTASRWVARVDFPERMIRRLRKSHDCQAGQASH